MHFLQRCSRFAYPFTIEAFFLVPQVIISSIYDAFTASQISTTKVSFQIWKQKSEGAKSGEYGKLGRTSKLHLNATAIATWEVWAVALSCKSITPRVNYLNR